MPESGRGYRMHSVNPLVIRVRRGEEGWSVDVPGVGLYATHACQSDAIRAACWVGRAFWMATDHGCLVVLEGEGSANRTLAHYHVAGGSEARLAS